MMKKIFRFLAILGLFTGGGSLQEPAFALTIDITRGQTAPLPIAIMGFQGGDALGEDISSVIRSDLQSSGLFQSITPSAFIQDPTSAHKSPRFADWRLLNAQALLTGIVTVNAQAGTLSVEFRLYDVFGGVQMDGKVLNTSLKNWRRLAHMVSDAVYQRVTGEQGYFDTRIVYIAESGPPKKRVKRLAIMDVDGHNHHFISDGREMVITPRFSPSSQLVTYMAFSRKSAKVYVLDLRTGKRQIVGSFSGLTFAPRFSPDGRKIIMSLAKDGITSLYTMDLSSRQVVHLTPRQSIDTSPSYSPDGSQIVFTSDRGGSPQIYVMNGNGSNPQRISFGNGSYTTPVWSPRGDLIAFTKKEDRFYIGVMRTDGSGERLLATGFLVEGPTWSPNGRVIMYTKEALNPQTGKKTSKLYSVDLTGFHEREILTPLEASDPAWSPLLTK
jgi:TolB protein